ncbi:MAG: prepilin-type N-terminal cleavage/methylation domain-containing protein [Pseudomonadota bacterium]
MKSVVVLRHLLRRRVRGFTLLETLVALGIAALALQGFYSALSTGSLLDARADRQAEKVLAATSILDRVGVDIPMRSGTIDNGEIGDLAWRLVIGTRPTPDMQLGFFREGELMFIAVTVSDTAQGGEPVTMRAIRYAENPL